MDTVIILQIVVILLLLKVLHSQKPPPVARTDALARGAASDCAQDKARAIAARALMQMGGALPRILSPRLD